MPRVTTPLRETRAARTPLQEGLSLLPYIWLSQRMHRRRWTQGLTAAAVAGLAVAAALRKRATPGS